MNDKTGLSSLSVEQKKALAKKLLLRKQQLARPNLSPTLIERLMASFDANSTLVALSVSGVDITYNELDDKSARVAAGFVAAGISANHLVAIDVEQVFDNVVALLALCRIGASIADIKRSSHVDLPKIDCVVTADMLRLAERSEPFERSKNGLVGPEIVGLASGLLYRQSAALVSKRLSLFLDKVTILPESSSLCRAELGYAWSLLDVLAPLCCGAKLMVTEFDNPSVDVRFCSMEDVQSILCSKKSHPRKGAIFAWGESVAKNWGATEMQVTLFYNVPELGGEVLIGDYNDQNGETLFVGAPLTAGVMVLDSSLRSVPERARGELYMAAELEDSSYLNSGVEASKRFVIDGAGNRLYRSGLIARKERDGKISLIQSRYREFWVDAQRIHLGMLEAKMLSLPAVDDCVIISRYTEKGAVLLAYYVSLRNFDAHQIASEVNETFSRDAASKSDWHLGASATFITLPPSTFYQLLLCKWLFWWCQSFCLCSSQQLLRYVCSPPNSTRTACVYPCLEHVGQHWY